MAAARNYIAHSRGIIVTIASVSGAIWAFGLSVEFFLDFGAGWPLIGAATGVLLAALVSFIRPQSRVIKSTAIILGWIGGGLMIASVSPFDILTGWLILSTLGGAITGLAMFGARRPMRALATAAGWIAAAVLGASASLAGGHIIAPFIGLMVGGLGGGWSLGGRIAWFLCWGAGGVISGAIGAFVLLQLARPLAAADTSARALLGQNKWWNTLDHQCAAADTKKSRTMVSNRTRMSPARPL